MPSDIRTGTINLNSMCSKLNDFNNNASNESNRLSIANQQSGEFDVISSFTQHLTK